MKALLLIAGLGVLVVMLPAHGQTQPIPCTDAANAKHLAGAALNSFMTKCKMDTTTRCNQAANDKKLSGAARSSFAGKCIQDGVGS